MSVTVAISGASGLVGSALRSALLADGHRVIRLVRRTARNADELTWNPSARLIDERRLAEADIIVNLAGESIGKRWTTVRRRRIRESRVFGTETIVGAIRPERPVTLINASAVGFYGDRGDEVLDETRSSGRGFLAEVCRQWEHAAAGAQARGARVVMLRSGVVLARDGGALPQMLMPFRMGVGGRIGSGRQWLSWIGIDDMVRAIQWVMRRQEISGPVNLSSPQPVTNADFTRAAARALHRPALFPVPRMILGAVLGEMADEMLLASQRAAPGVLARGGFDFEVPTIDDAMTRYVR